MKINKYMVSPSLPKELEPLLEITKNFWWCWNQKAVNLLRTIDIDNYDEKDHNPIRILGESSQECFYNMLHDDAAMMNLAEVYDEFKTYMNQETWYASLDDSQKTENEKIAYFSFEYGLHESLPNYSGGLGILSGDHLKSASDLGLPFIAVGLLYRKGYFRQYLNADGWQQEYDIENDFFNLALEKVLDSNGETMKVDVDLPGRKVYAQIWKANVGRIQLYYLDANIEENSVEDRDITAQLYGGNLETRIQQEILLGIGGIKALKKLGIKPTIYHMNEGHSAFLSLERIRQLMIDDKLDRKTAREVVFSSNVFTTHTPVPAGNDVFPIEMMQKYFVDYIKQIDMSMEEFLKLGKIDPNNQKEDFCMTVLALNLSAENNGVSELHGHVSREMWKDIWKGVPAKELPIDSITNGIHTLSWISFDMQNLLDRYLGPRWRTKPLEYGIWERVQKIPDAELWRTHERRKERLIDFCRERLKAQIINRGFTKNEINHAEQILTPEALTIGFARRFATYKRGTLLFRDIERLKKIISNPHRPVQIIFAGKAHPHDNGGKELIKNIAEICRREEFRDHIVFLEDYDINVARYMVQGVDVWLNNPRRPLEASGTSGMKVPPNGGLNFSILDGWWDEAYDGQNGWAIGNREEYTDLEYQDEVESNALYNVLENEIIPLYYERGRDDIPRQWVTAMKWSMQTVCPQFSTNRMVADYFNKFYTNASRRYINMTSDDFKKSKELKSWKDNISSKWSKVSFENTMSEMPSRNLQVGSKFEVKTIVNLGNIAPDSVRVELYHGKLSMKDEITEPTIVEMKHSSDLGNGRHSFIGSLECVNTGQSGYAIRMYPYHKDLGYKFDMKMIIWS
ncbi:glycosyltransferase family 1 protein [Brachyspira aalborgi]|uniref:Glycosyltransferase family 1 protein n=1 Tax=Brachyspira aalborgi TaxID=29522 RepID=A0A5C8GBE0_9SPIR|nr:alpha-glucan family phosphorylase [Brachyspira aalborgi]TXJ11867.1 glycosyltransferase family 1 protein [Brachyspira aalborgi]TXJ59117.1 glycosyltransferase family 1 protein [Brachyspira aalborgi]